MSTAQVVRTSNTQQVQQASSRIESLEVAYLTTELNLTTAEAQKFWPLFNEIREERDQLYRDKKKVIRDMAQNFKTMTDRQAQEYVDRIFEIESQLNESNFESRNRKIIKVIGPRRFLQLKNAEVQFKRKLLNEYRTRRPNIP
jgi:polyhydroxyalkanoate synthesis regulator phasin